MREEEAQRTETSRRGLEGKDKDRKMRAGGGWHVGCWDVGLGFGAKMQGVGCWVGGRIVGCRVQDWGEG